MNRLIFLAVSALLVAGAGDQDDGRRVRTWVTSSGHDDRVLDWQFDISRGHIDRPIEDAYRRLLEQDEPSPGDWQTALAAAECVAYLRGAPADVHPDVQAWLQSQDGGVTEPLLHQTLEIIDRVLTDSSLKDWWHRVHPQTAPRWEASVRGLRGRVEQGTSAPSQSK